MADVVWPQRAIDDIDEIVAYIAQFDPIAADDINVRLFRLGDSLTDFPYRGRPRLDGTRELVNVPPYILHYEVEGERVLILSIRHGRRRPLP